MVDVALATGLRCGELAALRREDLAFPDEETVRIHVVRARSKRAPDDDSSINHAEGENGTWKLGPPKSRRSRHVVVRKHDAVRLQEAAAEHRPLKCAVHREPLKPRLSRQTGTSAWSARRAQPSAT